MTNAYTAQHKQIRDDNAQMQITDIYIYTHQRMLYIYICWRIQANVFAIRISWRTEIHKTAHTAHPENMSVWTALEHNQIHRHYAI